MIRAGKGGVRRTTMCCALALALPGWLAGAESIVPVSGRVSDLEARLAYARLLSYRAETARAAAAEYERLLRESPGHAAAAAELAALREHEATAARDVRTADARGRIEEAEREAWAGHAARAREMFAREMAASDDPAIRLRAARAAIAWGDFNAGEKALRAALALTPANPGLKDELGRLLVSADRMEEAEQFYRRWIFEVPADPVPRIGLARLALKERNFRAALAAIEAVPTSGANRADLLRAKAEAALGLRQFAEAATAYRELAAADPAARSEAEIALGRIALREDDPEGAAGHFRAAAAAAPASPAARFALARGDRERTELLAGALAEPASPAPPGVRAAELHAWSGLFAGAGDFAAAIRFLRAAEAADPEYYPARLQLAEFLAIDEQFEEALRRFAALRQEFPESRQLAIAEARALAWSRSYGDSLAAYERLAALNPADPVPRREAARVAAWAKQYEKSAELYASAWADGRVDSLLVAALDRMAGPTGDAGARWKIGADGGAAASGGTEPFSLAERFEREREATREMEAVYLEILPALRLQRAWWLENRAKQFAVDRRFASAADTYRRLLELEPGNEEAAFDLSQAEAAQGLGRGEHAVLQGLLEIDPNHGLAARAVARRILRSQPVADFGLRFWRERGRGELASISRTVLEASVRDTYRDQATVRLIGQLGRESPATRGGRYAFRSAGAEFGAVFGPLLSAGFGGLHREFYDGRIGHADSGHAELWLGRDSTRLGLGWERREELANEFALFQGVRSDNLWLGGSLAMNRDLDVAARIASIRYDDRNDGIAFEVHPGLEWTDHPRVFKTILNLGYRDTDESSVYLRSGGRLVHLIHPYWTPQAYRHASLTLEWRHDLAREFYVGAQEHFYDLKLTFGLDSESNNSITLEGEWRREWADRWLLDASVYFNASRVWDAFGATVRLGRRFP